MSLLRILAKKKTSSTLASSNQQTTSTNGTPNIERPLFPTQEESGNSSVMCYLLGTFFSHSSTPSPCQCKSHGKKLTRCNEFLSFLDANCMIMK